MEDRPGCSERQWIESVCQWVLLHSGTNAETVFDIANQNLGIFCYEHVVKAFGNGGSVIVKQAGDHAIALEADSSSAVISFASSFLLLDAGSCIPTSLLTSLLQLAFYSCTKCVTCMIFVSSCEAYDAGRVEGPQLKVRFLVMHFWTL
jgi:hypothetical protein